MITGVNHVTLAVRSLDRSLAFYVGLLGLRRRARSHKTAHLQAGEMWIALVEDAATRSGPLPEYTHLAFTVSTDALAAMRDRLIEAGVGQWQENATEGASLYIVDPDGHKLELHASDLEARLAWIRDHGGSEWEVG